MTNGEAQDKWWNGGQLSFLQKSDSYQYFRRGTFVPLVKFCKRFAFCPSAFIFLFIPCLVVSAGLLYKLMERGDLRLFDN